jgi:hypothetical protein
MPNRILGGCVVLRPGVIGHSHIIWDGEESYLSNTHRDEVNVTEERFPHTLFGRVHEQ